MDQSYSRFLFQLAGKYKQSGLSKSEKSLAKRNATKIMLKVCKQIQTSPSIFSCLYLSIWCIDCACWTNTCGKSGLDCWGTAGCGSIGRTPTFRKPNFELKNLLLVYTVSLKEYSKTVFKKSQWPAKFATYFTWTHRLFFFGNYPSFFKILNIS